MITSENPADQGNNPNLSNSATRSILMSDLITMMGSSMPFSQMMASPTMPEPEKLKIETRYRCCIGSPTGWVRDGQKHWSINGLAYDTRTREIMSWVTDQLHGTKIEIKKHGSIYAVFENEAEATAFKLRWC